MILDESRQSRGESGTYRSHRVDTIRKWPPHWAFTSNNYHPKAWNLRTSDVTGWPVTSPGGQQSEPVLHLRTAPLSPASEPAVSGSLENEAVSWSGGGQPPVSRKWPDLFKDSWHVQKQLYKLQGISEHLPPAQWCWWLDYLVAETINRRDSELNKKRIYLLYRLQPHKRETYVASILWQIIPWRWNNEMWIKSEYRQQWTHFW